MADADENKDQNEEKAEESGKKSFIRRFLPWMIIGVVVVACAGAGFGLGRMLGGSETPRPNEAESNADGTEETTDTSSDEDSSNISDKTWYYDMDPVIANLDEPGVTRYVRASFTLEISAEAKQKEVTSLLDEKKPILTDMLFVYLSGLSLKEIQGDKNLKTIQSRIRTMFNEKLFPDSKPQIKRVLIKEFPVQ